MIIGVLVFIAFQTTNTAFAATVSISWNANTESDLAGYRVHYGTAKGSYSNHINVGNTTSWQISNLAAGTNYYFTLTAYDTAGNESLPSAETYIAIPAAAATGSVQPTVPLDTDKDGLIDSFETAAGLDANDPRDSLADADGDGVVNLVEYMANTDIHDPASRPAQDEALKDIIGEVGSISLSEINPSALYRFIPLFEGCPAPVDDILSIVAPGVYLYNVLDSNSALVYRLRVSLTERLLAVGAYQQASQLQLHDDKLGITVEIPVGAQIRDLEIGIGNTPGALNAALSDPQNSMEFDILPYGLVLTKPAQVTVRYAGETPAVERYDETTQQWVRVENVQAGSGTVSFSTQTVGHFQIYSQAEQTTATPPTDGGSGGGGGGCFIATAATY